VVNATFACGWKNDVRHVVKDAAGKSLPGYRLHVDKRYSHTWDDDSDANTRNWKHVDSYFTMLLFVLDEEIPKPLAHGTAALRRLLESTASAELLGLLKALEPMEVTCYGTGRHLLLRTLRDMESKEIFRVLPVLAKAGGLLADYLTETAKPHNRSGRSA
jgi:hypothetical protein